MVALSTVWVIGMKSPFCCVISGINLFYKESFDLSVVLVTDRCLIFFWWPSLFIFGWHLIPFAYHLD